MHTTDINVNGLFDDPERVEAELHAGPNLPAGAADWATYGPDSDYVLLDQEKLDPEVDFTSETEALGAHDAELTELVAQGEGPAKRVRTRGAPAVSTVKSDGTAKSIYECLVEYNLLRKMTDIVMAKVAVPWHLRADATQEIHGTWATLKAKPTYERNQLAHYAYLSGQHYALKLRRTIGAVVVLPGTIFRKGRDSAFMASIGAAVNPKDVEDYKDSLELSVEMPDNYQSIPVTEAIYRERFAGIPLSAKQKAIAERALLKRMSAEDIAIELRTTEANVERIINRITAKLLAKGTSAEAAAPDTAAAERGAP